MTCQSRPDRPAALGLKTINLKTLTPLLGVPGRAPASSSRLMTCQSRPYSASCAWLDTLNPTTPLGAAGRAPASNSLQQQADDLPVKAVLGQLRQAETHVP